MTTHYNPTNTQSEYPSEEVIPTKDTDTINQNQELENMEVHKHPHHVTHKKKWTEYLLEFFMLFFAVYLGFVAENIREHNVEKKREKVYINNLYEDLKSDTAIYIDYIKYTTVFATGIDSLLKLMKNPNRNFNLSKIYFIARNITLKAGTVFPNQRTFTQLKSSGLLRLISNQKVADDISSYYLATDEVFSQNNIIKEQIAHYWDQVGNLFESTVLYKIRQERKPPDSTNLTLMNNDPIVINKFLVSSQYLYGSRMNQTEKSKEMLQKAIALMILIKKKYQLE